MSVNVEFVDELFERLVVQEEWVVCQFFDEDIDSILTDDELKYLKEKLKNHPDLSYLFT